MSTTPTPTKPPQGSPAELERTQVWWLTWIYVPVMSLIAIAAFAVTTLDGFHNHTAGIVFILVAANLVGAGLRFRQRRADLGRIAEDERDETQTMRTMGYAYCFALFGTLIWAVAWAAVHADSPSAVPVPLLVLAGLLICLGLGRLSTLREGFTR